MAETRATVAVSSSGAVGTSVECGESAARSACQEDTDGTDSIGWGGYVWKAASRIPSESDVEMSEAPYTAEESTSVKLAPALERIIAQLERNASHHDYLVALLIILLAESGFHVTSCANDDGCVCEGSRTAHIPSNWKNRDTGTYEILFSHRELPDVRCKLLAYPSGDTLVVNFFPLAEEGRSYSMAVQTLKHVNPFSSDLTGRFHANLREISHRFKDKLCAPVRADILTGAGLTNPSLRGLPTELKLRILGLLGARELTSLARTCTEFRELCADQRLWRRLAVSMLNYQEDEEKEENRDWKAVYRALYKRRSCAHREMMLMPRRIRCFR